MWTVGRVHLLGLLLVGFVLGAAPLQGASATVRRVALVIGIADYQQLPRLRNPVRDARLLDEVFRQSLHFDVVDRLENPDRDTMARAIAEFSEKAQGADVAVIYYSGHGVQNGQRRNYLIPRDRSAGSDAELKAGAIAADDLVEAVSGAQIKLIILDACRDSPNGKKGGSKGLARMSGEGESLLIAYATEEGKTAEDGTGENSPYARALADSLRQTNRPILAQFDAVARAVRASAPGQNPQRYGSLETDVFLVTPEHPASAVAGPFEGGGSSGRSDEDVTWAAAQAADNIAGYQAYLADYPQGPHRGAAHVRIASLAASAAPNTAGAARPASTLAADTPRRRIGVVREVFKTFGYLRIELDADASVSLNETVYVQAEGQIRRLHVARIDGRAVSAMPSDETYPLLGSEVLK